MDNESKQAIQAEYELQSTAHLHERYMFYKEQVAFLHSTARTRGSRSEARARFHLRLIEEELAKRSEVSVYPAPSMPYPFVDKSKSTLGDLLRYKEKKCE